jgi:hypothetical protein
MFVVVTLACIFLAWVAYSLNWIMERRAMLETGVDGDYNVALTHYLPYTRAPRGLWLLGESGVFRICLGHACELPIDDVKRLFPEADVQQFDEWFYSAQGQPGN